MKRKLVLLIAYCAAVLSGCAIGNTHRYHDTLADINFSGSITIAVATHDQREYVLSGVKEPDFVGLSRGGFGNPFNINTESGKQLAEDMTLSIANSLGKKGFKVVPVLVPHSDQRQAVVGKLKGAGGERLLIFTLSEWKSDTYMNTALLYDIKAEVLNKEGTTLAQKSLNGKDDLGGSFMNPPQHAKEAVPVAFKEKIEKLLKSPEIEAALR
ncbi:MAG: hypothetical protein AABZ15_01950 [Nitrospirota bacterium]